MGRAAAARRRTPGVYNRAHVYDELQRMVVLDSRIDPADAVFQSNRGRMQTLVADLKARLARAQEGGGARYVQRHREQGKLPVRERIDRLLDPGSPFLELSALAASGMYDDEAPSAGIV